jgi:hypothetical protein
VNVIIERAIWNGRPLDLFGWRLGVFSIAPATGCHDRKDVPRA